MGFRFCDETRGGGGAREEVVVVRRLRERARLLKAVTRKIWRERQQPRRGGGGVACDISLRSEQMRADAAGARRAARGAEGGAPASLLVCHSHRVTSVHQKLALAQHVRDVRAHGDGRGGGRRRRFRKRGNGAVRLGRRHPRRRRETEKNEAARERRSGRYAARRAGRAGCGRGRLGRRKP